MVVMEKNRGGAAEATPWFKPAVSIQPNNPRFRNHLVNALAEPGRPYQVMSQGRYRRRHFLPRRKRVASNRSRCAAGLPVGIDWELLVRKPLRAKPAPPWPQPSKINTLPWQAGWHGPCWVDRPCLKLCKP
jgi:hypothetical protein